MKIMNANTCSRSVLFFIAAILLFSAGFGLSYAARSSRQIMFFAGNKIAYIRLFRKISSIDALDRVEGYILASEMGITDGEFYRSRYFEEKQVFVRKIILKSVSDAGNRELLRRIYAEETDEGLKKYINGLINGGNDADGNTVLMELVL